MIADKPNPYYVSVSSQHVAFAFSDSYALEEYLNKIFTSISL